MPVSLIIEAPPALRRSRVQIRPRAIAPQAPAFGAFSAEKWLNSCHRVNALSTCAELRHIPAPGVGRKGNDEHERFDASESSPNRPRPPYCARCRLLDHHGARLIELHERHDA